MASISCRILSRLYSIVMRIADERPDNRLIFICRSYGPSSGGIKLAANDLWASAGYRHVHPVNKYQDGRL
ncbi:hypothetical protein DPMN_075950 [Dreissena polymorpha]|uniref:Uncharacterized protein n=1 Tax=Dreissena polymorpha TaxID=45954 RepID=A0A9D4BMZ5_DREPO|nr:hypothetical protein DPMN_075950 [Dreissena polymorpha]